ncbi:hypothetical protein ACFV0L_29425 [Streptosporangium canum]|uniref:hypothetical protein n=1 Tax=Streptosporangium canum TaxID=324952 RepID=UPI00367E9D65
MSTPLSLRMNTVPGTGLGLDPAEVDRYMELADKGLLVGANPGCNAPAVQDDFALDPSRTVVL